MPQLLSLSRAARLAGTTRGQLQKKLRDTNIEAFEGSIRVSDLLALYPDINLDSDPVFERVQHIKQSARPKSEYSDGWLPEAEVLMVRLKAMHGVLMRTKASLYSAEALLRQVQERLATLSSGDASPRAVADLDTWLCTHLPAIDAAEDPRAALFAGDAFLKVLAPSVRILGTGHEFYIEGRDSILEAGLKAGLHLEYGCSSGNCGTCKVRVASGKVKQIRPHDYLLTAREKETGHILACSCTAVTDVVIEAAEARRPEDLPRQEIRAGVTRIEQLGSDLALLYVKTPRTHTLRFMSGQYIVLTDENRNSVELPIASCPCDGRNLQFFVERRSNSPFSLAVFDGSLADQALTLTGPEGDFILQEESMAPAVLVALEAGFAPIKSLIEHAISIDNAESLYLYVTGWGETVPHVNNLCRSWRDALDNFHFTALDTATPADVILERMRSAVPNLGACEIYLAGPRADVVALREVLLHAKDVTAERLRMLAID